MSAALYPRFDQVQALLGEYYDALYHLDVARLAEVFHPKAQYFTVQDGELLHLDMPTYLPIVAARESPHQRGEAYRMELESIEFAGPHSAFARLRCSLFGKHYIDLLSLLYLDQRWRIVSKVFDSTESSESL